jgi:hypothetical protein
MAQFRIIHRTTYEGTIPDDPWKHENESDPVWDGNDLPTDFDQEMAIIESIVVGPQQIAYDVTPDVAITEHRPVLQQLTKIGSFPIKLAWRDYIPKDDDSRDNAGWQWTRNDPNVSR